MFRGPVSFSLIFSVKVQPQISMTFYSRKKNTLTRFHRRYFNFIYGRRIDNSGIESTTPITF